MADEEPLLRVVRGTPTPEELAALVGAIFLRPRPTTSARPSAVSTWARLGRPGNVSASGMPARNSRDAWRISGLPH
ncbi:acyl-CoA carboxylase subunit epsilon [Micromonospora sp. WMMD1102]|uniref:acyl-CoA carboxylase subunit epsilon n=1 Tax=Micromonospora sp. WMMD1102 TaxID=3016105 RepID=UPI002415892C|nr:acyl-CoA carboxylase subunit epsilon [Micromonospora sp. WMMD1102]MDG4784517.1 acyl-CoA carboxylase subunit epsilon [Micromonospora sp. WMMD1102]